MKLNIFPVLLFLCSTSALAEKGSDTNQPFTGPDSKKSPCYSVPVPLLQNSPVIDANLDDWKYNAFCDGTWDIDRIRYTSWYNPKINRLTDHGNEPSPEDDLSARYYMAWSGKYLYLGAEVHDNINDINDPEPDKDRWYFKDAVCWYIEAPRDEVSEYFAPGDNAFCFVIDPSKSKGSASWRRYKVKGEYLTQPFPPGSLEYEIKMNPWNRSKADFILEVRVDMEATLGKDNPDWHNPVIGDVYGLQIVHTDPDGGDYGGHFLIYGAGDDDLTWGIMIFSPPLKPIERKTK